MKVQLPLSKFFQMENTPVLHPAPSEISRGLQLPGRTVPDRTTGAGEPFGKILGEAKEPGDECPALPKHEPQSAPFALKFNRGAPSSPPWPARPQRQAPGQRGHQAEHCGNKTQRRHETRPSPAGFAYASSPRYFYGTHGRLRRVPEAWRQHG